MPARAPRPDNLTFSTPRPTYLSVFTCPTQRAWTSRRTPARAPRPDNLTFSTRCATRLTRPTRRSRNHSDVDKSLPDNNLTFSCSTRLTRPTRRSWNQSDVNVSLPVSQTYLFHSAAGKAYPTTLPVDRETFRPLNSTLLSKPVHSVSPDIPTDAGESTPGQTTFSFQIYARRC